jgi:hypothetical protein
MMDIWMIIKDDGYLDRCLDGYLDIVGRMWLK